ncbi:MAG: FmdB family zinc ribbon protein [Anaerolineae bacterium]|jgi:putative FmdB family regulatory protein|nr:zinc ribbon domain-containing protein [Chloroflexota bacterium]
MPIYEFKCRSCGKVFDLYVRSLFSRVEPVCPVCGGRTADKVVSNLGFGARSGAGGGQQCAPTGG